MANYTMTIREMMENELVGGVFTFDYPFYTENEKDKKGFEQLFIDYYYFNEIGFETPERFRHKLQAKLKLIMPYYQQLALTEWDKVKTIEQMMTSKNLHETTTHEQSIDGTSSSQMTGNSDNNLTSSVATSSNSESSVSETLSQTNKASDIMNGVAQSSLTDGYLTSSSKADGNTSQSNQQSTTANQSSTDNNHIESTQSNNSTNNQILSETTSFSSVGDVGIQTPAYAITEWRKVLININQMIINDCYDLFMKIY